MAGPRRLLLTFALLIGTGLAACDSDDGTGPSTPVAGTYTMQTVNGQALPSTVTIVAGAFRIEITGGTFVLRSDMTYTETINTRTVFANGTTETDAQVENGTYAVNGQSLLLTIPATDTDPIFSYDGTVHEGTLSYVFDGNAIVYKK